MTLITENDNYDILIFHRYDRSSLLGVIDIEQALDQTLQRHFIALENVGALLSPKLRGVMEFLMEAKPMTYLSNDNLPLTGSLRRLLSTVVCGSPGPVNGHSVGAPAWNSFLGHTSDWWDIHRFK